MCLGTRGSSQSLVLSSVGVSKISWRLCIETEFVSGWPALGLQCVALELCYADNDWM